MIQIQLPIFQDQVYATRDAEEARLWAANFGVIISDPLETGGTCYIDETGAMPIIIYIGMNTHSVIAHECDHAVNGILTRIGQQPDYKNDEVHAYLLGYLVDCLTSVFKPRRRKDFRETWGVDIVEFDIKEVRDA